MLLENSRVAETKKKLVIKGLKRASLRAQHDLLAEISARGAQTNLLCVIFVAAVCI